MSFRNRCIIAGSNGLVNLSVPILSGRDQRLPYRNVKISHQENWPLKHWRTIVSCYARSPWFEYYASPLENIFQMQFEYLFELNLEILQWLVKTLGFSFPELITDNAHEADEIVDWRDILLPKNYKSTDYTSYQQLFEDRIGFQPNLSILDLLMMQGPATKNLLLQ